MEVNETPRVNCIKGFQTLIINSQKEFRNKRKTGFSKLQRNDIPLHQSKAIEPMKPYFGFWTVHFHN